jgi:hypothetical protein
MTLLPTSTPASEELIWRVNSLEETLKYIGKLGGGDLAGTKSYSDPMFLYSILKITRTLQIIVHSAKEIEFWFT